MTFKSILASIIICLCVATESYSQASCKPPEVIFNKNAYNIFDDQQDIYLGEVIAENVGKNYRIITDEEANRYVREVGEKLVRHLPPTNIKFQFYVTDIPVLNAFNAGGGRIYITRKMIAFLRTEDELAGILGHELGHGVVHHIAIDMSKYFKEVLGVDKVTDRKDIFTKYHQLLDKQNTKRVKIKDSHENDQQLEADRIGLYAVVASGYDPAAFTSTFDRLIEAKGKTGNTFTDIFGTTTPAQKRLREMMNIAAKLPPECTEKRNAGSNEAYEKWKSYVVTTPTFQKEEKLDALIEKRSLNPYLRGEIKHLRFSPDGSYLLAQDDAGVNVLTREPFAFLFRIEAPGARQADFTPDSKYILFQRSGLRIEKWSVADKKPAFVREIFKQGGYWQSAISPDGEYMVIYTYKADLELIDTKTSAVVWKKTEFYLPYYYETYDWLFQKLESDTGEVAPLQLEFSPSGRYFLGARVATLKLGFDSAERARLFWDPIDTRQEVHCAFDLQTKKEIKLKGDLEGIIHMPYSFYSDDKIIGQHPRDKEKSGIYGFPNGEKINNFALNASSYSPAYKGDYVVVRPTVKNPVGVFDPLTKTYILANKTSALDVYGEFFVSENKSGEIGLFKADFQTKQVQNVGMVNLPKTTFGQVRTISMDPDFSWLAVSENSRGGVWNLKTGQREIYIRGFRGSFFDTDGNVYTDFPYYEKAPRSVGVLNPLSKSIGLLDPIVTRNTRQNGKFLIRIRGKEETELDKKVQEAKEKKEQEEKSGDKDKENKKKPTDVSEGLMAGVDVNSYVYKAGTMEVYDIRTRKMLWSKFFPDEVPSYQFNKKSETTAIYWKVTTKAAKNEIKAKPALSQKMAALGEKDGDYLVQIIDANTGNQIGETLIETGEGSFTIENIFLDGDWLTITDSENRVLLYSLSKGELRWRFFGDYPAINAAKAQAAIENAPGQVSIYSLETGEKIDELLFPYSISNLTFSQDGKKMFALTSNQNYYLFDTAKFGAGGQ